MLVYHLGSRFAMPDVSQLMNQIPCSSNIRTVVERETEGSSVGEAPLCTACEMAVVWMQNQLKQEQTKEKVLEYVNQVK